VFLEVSVISLAQLGLGQNPRCAKSVPAKFAHPVYCVRGSAWGLAHCVTDVASPDRATALRHSMLRPGYLAGSFNTWLLAVT